MRNYWWGNELRCSCLGTNKNIWLQSPKERKKEKAEKRREEKKGEGGRAPVRCARRTVSFRKQFRNSSEQIDSDCAAAGEASRYVRARPPLSCSYCFLGLSGGARLAPPFLLFPRHNGSALRAVAEPSPSLPFPAPSIHPPTGSLSLPSPVTRPLFRPCPSSPLNPLQTFPVTAFLTLRRMRPAEAFCGANYQ